MSEKYGRIEEFTYILPSAFADQLVVERGYFYVPPYCSNNVRRITYFLLGAGCDIGKFVCEGGNVEDFHIKNRLDKAVEDAYIPNDMIVCFLSHLEGSPIEDGYSKNEEVLMAQNFAKHFEGWILPRIEKKVLPMIIGDFHTNREGRILAGFSFGGGIVLAMLREAIYTFRNFLVLSAYHLEKIGDPSANIKKILECEFKALERLDIADDVKLIGYVGEFDIAKKEMQYEFEVIKQMRVFHEDNIDLFEISQGTHDYFCASQYLISGLHQIYVETQP